MNDEFSIKKKAVLIGYGNLAFHLGSRLRKKGYSIIEIVGKNASNTSEVGLKNREKLAEEWKASICTDLKKITKEADIYFICTGDNAILEICEKLKLAGKLVIHCSGSVAINPLKKISSLCGVLYPLQTFSMKRKLKWKEIPLFLEANNKKAEYELNQLANALSKKITWMKSVERKKLHLAAVISSNFNNHLLLLTKKYLNNETAFQSLFPLLQETFLKAEKLGPENAQTGPAIRQDEKTIAAHLKELKTNSELKALYTFFTQSIKEHHRIK